MNTLPSVCAATAGILRADMAVYEEAGRFHIQLLADVFADLHHIAAAGAALARRWFVAVFDTRQLWRQCLASGTAARLGFALALRLLQLRFQSCQVSVQCLIEQVQPQRKWVKVLWTSVTHAFSGTPLFRLGTTYIERLRPQI